MLRETTLKIKFVEVTMFLFKKITKLWQPKKRKKQQQSQG